LTALVVVNDLKLQSISVFPNEADSPLIIDLNTVLSNPVAPKLLKPVRWWNPQRIQAAGRRQNFELSRSQTLNVPGQPPGKPTTKDSLSFPAFEGLDHESKY
jgi:hypothetical protein